VVVVVVVVMVVVVVVVVDVCNFTVEIDKKIT
jgi:hypothetical protein